MYVCMCVCVCVCVCVSFLLDLDSFAYNLCYRVHVILVQNIPHMSPRRERICKIRLTHSVKVGLTSTFPLLQFALIVHPACCIKCSFLLKRALVLHAVKHFSSSKKWSCQIKQSYLTIGMTKGFLQLQWLLEQCKVVSGISAIAFDALLDVQGYACCRS